MDERDDTQPVVPDWMKPSEALRRMAEGKTTFERCGSCGHSNHLRGQCGYPYCFCGR